MEKVGSPFTWRGRDLAVDWGCTLGVFRAFRNNVVN